MNINQCKRKLAGIGVTVGLGCTLCGDGPCVVPDSDKVDAVVASVRSDLLRRSEIGIKKYSTTLDQNPATLRQWLQHAYEETLDQANYLKCAIMKIDGEI